MKHLIKHIASAYLFKCVVLSALLIILSGITMGATFTSSGSGNWNNSATWGGAGVPTATDNVIINGWGHTVTLQANSSCTNITIKDGSTLALNGYNFNNTGTASMTNQAKITGTGTGTTLTLGSGISLADGASYISTTGYAITINGNVALTNQGYLNIGASNLTITGNLSFDGQSTYVAWTNGDVTVGGNITYAYSWGTVGINCSGTGYLIMNGGTKSFTVNSALTIKRFKLGSSTITKAGAGALTINTTYDKNCFTTMAGTYSVTGSTINCATVTADAGTDKKGCLNGSNITLGGSPTASGGTPTYVYSWAGSVGAPSVSDATIANPIISPTAAGTFTYTVTVTDNAGAGNTSSDFLLVTINVTPSASNDGPKCAGTTLTLSSLPNSGTYNWAGPSSFTSTNQNPTRASLTTSHAGTYTVTVTINGQGCTATTSVVVNSLPTVTLTLELSTVCNGQTFGLTAGGASTYAWSTPPGGTAAIRTHNPAVNTTYTVTGTDAIGCSNTATNSVTILGSTSASHNSPSCTGTTLSLDCSPAGTSYTWSGPNSFTSSTKNPTVSSSATLGMSGTYNVTVSYPGGCVQTAGTIITVNASPTASINANNNGSICNSSINSVTLTASGGTSYAWNDAGANPHAVSPSTTTTYTVTVTDVNSCTASSTTFVRYKTAGIDKTHSGAGVNITALGGTNYIWSTTEATATIHVTPPVSDTYTVTIDNGDAASCTDEVVVTYVPCVATTYYSTGSGNISNPATWNSASDGSGCNPIIVQLTNNSSTLIIQNTHTITINTDISIINLTTNAGGSLVTDTNGIHTFTISGNITNNGSINLYNSNSKATNIVFAGSTTISGNAITFNSISMNDASTLVAGALSHVVKDHFSKNASATFTPGTSTFTLNGTTQSITTSAVTFNNLTLTNGTKTLINGVTATGTFTISENTTVSALNTFSCATGNSSGSFDISNGSSFTTTGTWTQNNNSILKLGCTYSFGTLNASGTTNTVVYQCQTPNTTIDLIKTNYASLIINTIDTTSIVRWQGADSRNIANLYVNNGNFQMNTANATNVTGVYVAGNNSVFHLNNSSTIGGLTNLSVTYGGKFIVGTYASGTNIGANSITNLTVDGAGSSIDNYGGLASGGNVQNTILSDGGRLTNKANSRFSTGSNAGAITISGNAMMDNYGYIGNIDGALSIGSGGTGGSFILRNGSQTGTFNNTTTLYSGTLTTEVTAITGRMSKVNVNGGIATLAHQIAGSSPEFYSGPAFNQSGGITNFNSTQTWQVEQGPIITGGTMNISRNSTIDFKNANFSITNGALNNAGTLTSSTSGFLINTGSTVHNTGTMITTHPGDDMTITGTTTFTNDSIINLPDALIINNANVTLINNGYMGVANFNQSAGNFYNFCKVNITSNYQQDGGAIYGTQASDNHVGAFYVAGTSTWNGGSFGTASSVFDSINFYDAGTPAAKWDVKCGACTAGSATTYSAGALPVSVCSDILLPIALLNFTAKCNNEVIGLNWVTASETNNEKFILEHSTDGINFETLATITGAGNSNKLITYNYTDKFTSEQVNYYRLTQVDYDGKSEIFPVISATCGAVDKTIQLHIIKNPTTAEQISFYISGFELQTLHVTITDLYGNIVFQEDQTLYGNQLSTVNFFNHIASGMYIIKITNFQINLESKLLVH